MIAGAVVAPAPLFLLPEYASLADPGRPWREAAAAAIAQVAASGVDEVVVVAPGAASRHHTRPPAGLRVAEEYLAAAAGAVAETPVERVVIGEDASPDDCAALGAVLADGPGRTMLLVLADGSARRGVKAPGHLDERAAGYDDAWRGAVAEGDTAALATLDPALAADLLAAGRAPLQVLAAATALDAAPVTATVHAEGDPYGVAYLVAAWECGETGP